MKTTLDLPEEVYRELKIRAAREGTTLTKLIASALTTALSRPTDQPTGMRQRPLKKRDEQQIREWLENESDFLESMRGPVFGEGAVADLFGGRR